MMGSGEHMSFYGGYGVDGGRSGYNLEDVVPIAMESAIVFKLSK